MMTRKEIKINPSDAKSIPNEQIRVVGSKMKLNVVLYTGKEGDFFIAVAPSIKVSAYGINEDDAFKSFMENIEVFCEDMLALSHEERDSEFRKLGFKKETYRNKNFSKVYVDENGVLQGLEPDTIKINLLETA